MSETKYCIRCGAPIEENTSFCRYCGQPQQDPSAKPESAILQDPVNQEPEDAPRQNPANPNPGLPIDAVSQKPRKKGAGGFIALLISIGVLAIGCIVLIFVMTAMYNKIERYDSEMVRMQAQIDSANQAKAAAEQEKDAAEQAKDAAEREKDTAEQAKDAAEQKYTSLQSAQSDALKEYEFFHEYAVVCSRADSYYHRYNCSHCDLNGFWIYNIDSAKSMGFTACPYCFGY